MPVITVNGNRVEETIYSHATSYMNSHYRFLIPELKVSDIPSDIKVFKLSITVIKSIEARISYDRASEAIAKLIRVPSTDTENIFTQKKTIIIPSMIFTTSIPPSIHVVRCIVTCDFQTTINSLARKEFKLSTHPSYLNLKDPHEDPSLQYATKNGAFSTLNLACHRVVSKLRHLLSVGKNYTVFPEMRMDPRSTYALVCYYMTEDGFLYRVNAGYNTKYVPELTREDVINSPFVAANLTEKKTERIITDSCEAIMNNILKIKELPEQTIQATPYVISVQVDRFFRIINLCFGCHNPYFITNCIVERPPPPPPAPLPKQEQPPKQDPIPIMPPPPPKKEPELTTKKRPIEVPLCNVRFPVDSQIPPLFVFQMKGPCGNAQGGYPMDSQCSLIKKIKYSSDLDDYPDFDNNAFKRLFGYK